MSDDQLELLRYLLELSSRPGERPFMPVVEFLLSAERALYRGRYGQAVIEAGTAIELLVNTSLREAFETDRETLEKVMRKSYRQRAVKHFAELAGFSSNVDEADDSLGRWWQGGYQLRNRVVHEGYLPSHEEASTALEAAHELVERRGAAYGEDLGPLD